MAMGLITSHIPEPSPEERAVALAAAAEYLLSKGTTTVTDLGRCASARPPAPGRERMPPSRCCSFPAVQVVPHCCLAAWLLPARELAAPGLRPPRRAPFADVDATWRDLEHVLDPAAAAGQLPIR